MGGPGGASVAGVGLVSLLCAATPCWFGLGFCAASAGKGTIPDLGGSLTKFCDVTTSTKIDTVGLVVASLVT